MGSYSMGYHYDMVTRGKGYKVSTDTLEFNHVTQQSSRELKQDLERWGHVVTIEKETDNV
jgi:hypothetical protein